MPTNLTRKRRTGKPTKPHKDFPLFPHPNGQWAKKIRSKVYYFGKWEAPQAALHYYLEVKDDLLAGRSPKPKDGFTVVDLCNHFLTAKHGLVQNDELTDRSFADYRRTTDHILKAFDKNRLVSDLRPEDFGGLRQYLSRNLGPVALRNEIGRIRVVFKFAYDNVLTDCPVRYGSHFNPPSKRVLRKDRQSKPLRMLEATEIRNLLKSAAPQLKAMILLGINCGLGNKECAFLTDRHIDLEHGWLDYPRPKTGIARQSPLWTETVKALRAVVDSRSLEASPLVFRTKYGHPWVRSEPSKKSDGKLTNIDAVAQQFRKLLKQCGIPNGRNFGALRHTFRTIGCEAGDQVAVDSIMGHVRNDMASHYRERISQERFRRVTEYIHNWLYSTK